MGQSKHWIGLGLLLALGSAAYLFWGEKHPPPEQFRTVPVERKTIVQAVGATGTINPVTSVQVGAQVTGKIVSLHADYNSVVKAGDIIARIDPSSFQARRDQAAANLANAKATWTKLKADLAQRKRELERTKTLFKREMVSQNEFDIATTAYEGAVAQLEVANAQIQQAKAVLASAELDLKYTVIPSPVNGIVIARNVEVGQTVTAGFTTPNLFLIALDLTKMQVDTNVSEADVGGIREGNDVVFTVDAYPDSLFNGTVKQIRNAPIIVQNVVTYDVVVEVDNTDLRLKPGMTATVSIIIAQKELVPTVPNAAFRFTLSSTDRAGKKKPGSGDQLAKSAPQDQPESATQEEPGRRVTRKSVWKLEGPGNPVQVLIRTGISDGSVTEILDGNLQEGDQVIIGMGDHKDKGGKPVLPPGFDSGRRPGGSRSKSM